MAWHVQRDVNPQVRFTLVGTRSVSTPRMAHSETHPIPLHTPIHHRCKHFVSTDIDVQAVGLITPTSLIGRHLRLAVVLRITGRTRIHDLDDDTAGDLAA